MKQLGNYTIYLGVGAFCILFSVVALAPSSPANSLVSVILCGSGSLVVNYSGEFGIAQQIAVGNLECIVPDGGTSYIVTNRYLVLLFISSFLPICLGMGLHAIQQDNISPMADDKHALSPVSEDPNEDPDELRDKLEKLKDDCDAGLITADEYEASRQKLLNRHT